MNKKIIILACVIVIGVSIVYRQVGGKFLSTDPQTSNVGAIIALVRSPFLYRFSVPGILHESGDPDSTSSPYWWLNSGGEMIIEDGLGKTIHGNLPINNKWRIAYAKANPMDTDNGYHPQNIFRLVSRNVWHNFQQESYFKIDQYNVSSSTNRNESNGILLFNRYADSDNLYYTGIRVDGAAVIKKKYKGIYYTMAYKSVFPGVYNISSNPNLLPLNTWIGLRSEVTTTSSSTVLIRLYADVGKTGQWKLVAEATDDGVKYGSGIIDNTAGVGIRTDFMDVDFTNYKISNL